VPPVRDYCLVRQGRGPEWDRSKRRREQAGWDRHLAFVDGLGARTMFDADPWMGSILRIAAIERWNPWIGADRL
jgi:hypothetical protein